jgi:hypothetical protein
LDDAQPGGETIVIAAALQQRAPHCMLCGGIWRYETGRPAMSLWRALFGGGAAATEKASDPVEYKGFVIHAAPYKNNGHYQTAGTIARDIDGVRKEHRFIRADACASYDDAVNFTLNKARQIIDLQGERIFD